MTGGRFDLDRAKQDCETARTQLADTIGEITNRLSPRVLFGQAWGEIREKSGDAADEAVRVVRSQPVAVSGVAAAVGLFLARKPLGRLIAGLRNSPDDEHVVHADLDREDARIDLTAPVIPPPPATPPVPVRPAPISQSQHFEE